MRGVAERAWFRISSLLGQLLRAGRYSTVQIVDQDDYPCVRKARAFYAPLLIGLGKPLMKMLNTGVTVLSECEWHERERDLYRLLFNKPVATDTDGALILPLLNGVTLASLLEEQHINHEIQKRAITLAVVALREFHARGLTHGDAMAENVLVDLENDVASWFDFETVHDTNREVSWCWADDMRAFLSTVLLRTPHNDVAEMLQFILDSYANTEIQKNLANTFSSVFQRQLVFHLGQAGLSLVRFREIGWLLKARMR